MQAVTRESLYSTFKTLKHTMISSTSQNFPHMGWPTSTQLVWNAVISFVPRWVGQCGAHLTKSNNPESFKPCGIKAQMERSPPEGCMYSELETKIVMIFSYEAVFGDPISFTPISKRKHLFIINFFFINLLKYGDLTLKGKAFLSLLKKKKKTLIATKY